MKRKLIFIAIGASVLILLLGYTFTTTITSYAKTTRSFQNLESTIYRRARHFPGRCAYVIKDVSRPIFQVSYAQYQPFPAASVIKIPIAAVAFKAVKEKKITLEQPITIYNLDITGGSGELKNKDTPITLSFGELLKTMLASSDNTATNKVIDILGYAYINRSFRSLGLRRTILRRKMMDFSRRKHGVENYTSAADIAFLLEKIYKGKLIDKESSQHMLDFLKQQKIKDRIPKYLPKNMVIAHKTGLERSVVHDAGIIFSHCGDYLVCVLTRTKSKTNYSVAKRFIANIALLTYTSLCPKQEADQ